MISFSMVGKGRDFPFTVAEDDDFMEFLSE